MFIIPQQQELKEVLINSDDILIKILNYIKFWKQKSGKKFHVIFLLRIIQLFLFYLFNFS